MNCRAVWGPALLAAFAAGGNAASPAWAQPPRLVTPENMCGALALSCAAYAAGAAVDVERLVEELPLNGQMKSFADLEGAAQRLGLATRPVRWRRDQAPQVTLPCIIRLVPNTPDVGPHFIVLVASGPGVVCLIDPPGRPTWVAAEDLFREWDGVALYVAADTQALRASAPVPSIVSGWTWLIPVIVGSVMLLGCFASRYPKAAGEGDAGRPARRVLALSAVGWVAVAIGLVWVAGTARSSRKSTISVDSPSQTIQATESALRAQDGRVRGIFLLTNRGARPAVIASVVPNCSCARVDVSPRRIPPGGSSRIVVDVDLEDRSTAEARLLVEFEDAVPQQLTLLLTAKRVPDPPR